MRNDFEKGVQQKMEQFEIAPTDAVWNKVEVRIGKERRRVRMFYLSACTVAVIAVGVVALYFGINSTPGVKVIAVKEQADKSGNKIINSKENSNQEHNNNRSLVRKNAKDNRTGRIAGKTSRGNNKAANNKQTLAVKKENTLAKRASNRPNRPQVIMLNKNYTLNRKTVKPRVESVVVLPGKQINNETKANVDETFIGKRNAGEDKQGTKLSKNEELLKRDTIANQQEVKKSTLNNDTISHHEQVKRKLPLDSVSANIKDKVSKNVKLNSNKKLAWGISLLTGFSDNVSGLKLGPSAKASSDALYASPNYSANANFNIKPSYSSSFSYGAGVVAEYKGSNRFSISAGLNYHLYSVKVKVGSRVDSARSLRDSSLNITSSVGNYYRAGGQAEFRNKLNLIEVPINLQWRLNRNDQRPLQLTAGISPGLIVASNALYYNRYQGVFYEEKEQLKRFQLSIQTGLSATLINQQKYRLRLGPLFQYSLSNLTTREVQTNEHLLFIGLRTSIIFKK